MSPDAQAPVLASRVVRVEQVDFISIATRDVARAIAWYRDVLGLPESEVSDGELETPNVTLSFWEPEVEDLPFARNEAGFAIRVSDVSAARAELEAKGVEFIAETWDSASATSPRSATRTATRSSSIAATRRGFRAIGGDGRLCERAGCRSSVMDFIRLGEWRGREDRARGSSELDGSLSLEPSRPVLT